MHVKRSASLACNALALVLGTFAGCTSDPYGASGAGSRNHDAESLAGPRVSSSASEPRIKVVNAFCPIESDHRVGEGKSTVPSLTREFNGKRVGFCCDQCPPAWDSLSEDDRRAALDSALAKEKPPAPQPRK